MENNKIKIVSIRVSANELQELKKESLREKKKVSTFIRDLIFNKVNSIE